MAINFDEMSRELDDIIEAKEPIVSPEIIVLMRKLVKACEAMLIQLDTASRAGMNMSDRISSVKSTMDKAKQIIRVYE